MKDVIDLRPTSFHRALSTITVAVLMFAACGGEADDDGDDDDSRASAQAVDDSANASTTADSPTATTDLADVDVDAMSDSLSSTPSVPAPVTIAADATWQWQLQDDINTSHDADVYDIDLFDTPQVVIDELHDDGRIVICYYSAGSHEEWRDDAMDYPADVIGDPLDDWEGERWVDTRSDAVRAIIDRRHDLAVEKGCDGVEPDNITAFDNDSGFELTADDQLDFNRFLADSAHERGLLIALKNDLSQIPQLVDHFDFAVNEQCLEYDECDVYAPFVEAGKAVLNAEYATRFVDDPDAACADAASFGVSMLILPLDLDDGFRIAC